MSEKFKALSFTAKVQYIWEFYKLRIAIVVVLIALAGVLIHGWVTNVDASLYCLVFNDLNNEKIEERIKQEYSDFIGGDPKSVNVDTGFGFKSSGEEEYNQMDEGSSVRFLGAQATGSMDVIISDYEGFLTDVKSVLPKNLYEQLEPYFVYATFNNGTDNEQSDGIVYGLDISDTDFYKGYDDNYKEALIAFPTCSKNVDAAVQFVKCVYGIK
jgi:hypothetical protein